MKIDAGTFLKLTPARQRGKIPGHIALEIVQKVYCGPMTVRGFCSGRCADCQERLQVAFSLEGARNEQAVLTWRLKSALTLAQDSAGDHQNVARKDRFGLPMSEDTNPFETLKRYYEKPAKER